MGVPKGYIHNWKYTGRWSERKIAPGTWKGTFKATKGKRSGKGGPLKGSKVKWKLQGIQTAYKTAPGRYQTNFKFKKTLLSSNIKTKKRRRR